jgi:hypothetical protein
MMLEAGPPAAGARTHDRGPVLLRDGTILPPASGPHPEFKTGPQLAGDSAMTARSQRCVPRSMAHLLNR